MLNNVVALLGGAAPEVGDYESIQTYTVGAGGQATISFTSIASTYKHLQIRYTAHSAGVGADYTLVNLRFNSDSGSNYVYHRLYGNGSSVSANAATGQTAAVATWIPDDLTMASSYGVNVIDILDYASTNKYKTIRNLGGFDMNGSGLVGLFSGLWTNTAAISQIDLTTGSGQNFKQYSSFALYGIK